MIESWVNDYIGLEFEEKGRVDKFDCWGLVRKIYSEQHGILMPSYVDDYVDTDDIDTLGHLISVRSDDWQQNKLGCEASGDVVVLRMRGQPMHVGVVVGDGNFVHIAVGINSCMESYRSIRWKDRVIGFFRHKDL